MEPCPTSSSLRGVSRVERWERNSEIPLLLLAVAFLVAYAWPVLDTSMGHDLETFLQIVSWTVWVAFAADFATRIWLAAGDRKGYAVRHWYDAALIVLPMLRPLRVLRVLAFARVLNRSVAGNLVGQVTTYVVDVAVASVGIDGLQRAAEQQLLVVRRDHHEEAHPGSGALPLRHAVRHRGNRHHPEVEGGDEARREDDNR